MKAKALFEVHHVEAVEADNVQEPVDGHKVPHRHGAVAGLKGPAMLKEHSWLL